jgi:GNAT superfamily N-acetyltransferase
MIDHGSDQSLWSAWKEIERMVIETRACRMEERGALLALVNRVFDNMGDMGAAFPLLFGPDNLEGLRIVPAEQGPVAHVGVCIRPAVILGARLKVASIGAVCTDPAHRGRGLATALMADARSYAREQGASLMLISGGRGLYRRLGFGDAGRFDRYQLQVSQMHGLASPVVEVTEYQEEDLPAIAALQQAEPVRFYRSASDWRRLLQAEVLMCDASDLLTIRQEGRLVAYVGVQRPSAGDSWTRGNVRIGELAGSRSGIAAALPALLDRYEVPVVNMWVQRTDVEMAVQARSRGWSAQPQSFPGTVGVVDPPTLMEALKPLLVERGAESAGLNVTASEDGATFALGTEQLKLQAPGPLAALLFGGETAPAGIELPPDGALGHLLEALLPLPLLLPGYNYV